MKSVIALEALSSAEFVFSNQKSEKKAGKRIGFNYIILKSLKESQKNNVVKCLYIKSLTQFGICVIKEGSYGDSKDKHNRDIKDRLLWQKYLHELLQNKVRIPKLLGSFEENGNYYLVLEYIKGRSFYKEHQKQHRELRTALITGGKIGRKFLDYMLQVLDIIQTLHDNGVIHRDLTATNFMITSRGKIAVIDMELGYSLTQKHMPPFELGTRGYMSPEQQLAQTPTVKEDIFAIGAILLQLWTGSISPHKLTGGSIADLLQKIYFFIPDKQIADLVFQCLHPEPEFRPSLKEIKDIVACYYSDIKKKKKRPASVSVLFTRDQIIETIQQAIYTLSSPLLADGEQGWFSEKMNSQNNPDKNVIDKVWYASFNRGAAGIIYFLSQAKKAGITVNDTLPFVQKGLKLIQQNYIDRIEDASPGLDFGSNGIAVALVAAVQSNLIEPNLQYLNWIELLLEKQTETANVCNGLAGQGLVNLFCCSYISQSTLIEKLSIYVQNLLEKQEKNGCWINEESDNKKRMTKGFTNGTAGIIYFLLEYGIRFNHIPSQTAAERGLDWLMKKSIFKKDTLHWLSSKGKKLPTSWSEGSIGIGFTFLKAYQYTNNLSYKTIAEKCFRSQQSPAFTNNLSQCHGLSGTGEVYLEASQILNNHEWEERANLASQVIMNMKKQHIKHGPFWLTEDEHQPVANFMLGNSGILHFLLRHCFRNLTHFPLNL